MHEPMNMKPASIISDKSPIVLLTSSVVLSDSWTSMLNFSWPFCSMSSVSVVFVGSVVVASALSMLCPSICRILFWYMLALTDVLI